MHLAEFAEEIFKIAGMDVKVNYITTAEYPIRAKRPMNSRLSKKNLKAKNFELLRGWQESLNAYFI